MRLVASTFGQVFTSEALHDQPSMLNSLEIFLCHENAENIRTFFPIKTGILTKTTTTKLNNKIERVSVGKRMTQLNIKFSGKTVRKLWLGSVSRIPVGKVIKFLPR